ncbi:hypothetical protein BDB00DRAFT_551564, partial [Zychaea mexicana]|uniref:uncharacterized protein n=1 Tax=Zychaea mexicana TaxID=64656 RepID=UPI0022FE3194
DYLTSQVNFISNGYSTSKPTSYSRQPRDGSFIRENVQFCSNCKCENQPVELFVGKTRNYKTCRLCRERQSDVGKPIPDQLLVTMEEVEAMIPSRTDLPSANDTLEGYSLDVYVQLDEQLSTMADQELTAAIVGRIQAIDGYNYYHVSRTEPGKKFSWSFLHKCSQDFDVQHQVPDGDRLRLHTRMETFLCGGYIKGLVDKPNGYFYLHVEHTHAHQTAPIQAMRAVLTFVCLLYTLNFI